VSKLNQVDPEIADILTRELVRQNLTIQLIPSQSTVDESILEVQGSIFTNLSMEGYPGRRYLPGSELADDVERLAIERAKRLFGAEHANVQPHSGVNANIAVYLAALEVGDTVLGMSLSHGGHLSHGYSLSLSGRFYRFLPYFLDRATEQIDFDALRDLALREHPKMIVAGGSAYPRTLDFARFRAICDEVSALLMVDMAHIGGLIAAGLHPSPLPYADYVTGTAYKTLGGGKGAFILCRAAYAQKIDQSVFPGVQGSFGPQVVAAKAVTFKNAMTTEFRAIQGRIVSNAKRLAGRLKAEGYRLVADGTDTHLFLVDVGSRGLTGQQAEEALRSAGIYVNRNLIPFDERPALVASGIRVGTPAVTFRGFGEAEIDEVGAIITSVLANPHDAARCESARQRVEAICRRFPLYGYEDKLG